MVRALDLRLEIAASIPADAKASATLNECSHTFASVSKQYNLVPAYKLGSKQSHRATHWPRVHGLVASPGA